MKPHKSTTVRQLYPRVLSQTGSVEPNKRSRPSTLPCSSIPLLWEPLPISFSTGGGGSDARYTPPRPICQNCFLSLPRGPLYGHGLTAGCASGTFRFVGCSSEVLLSSFLSELPSPHAPLWLGQRPPKCKLAQVSASGIDSTL